MIGKDKKNIKELLDEVQSKFEDLKLEKDSFQNYEERENTAKWFRKYLNNLLLFILKNILVKKS